MTIEIKIVEDGDWGGTIPVMLRDDKVTLAIGNSLRITFIGDDFKNLRQILSDRILQRYNRAKEIVGRNDRRANIVRILGDNLEEFGFTRNGFLMFDTPLSEDDVDKIEEILAGFYNAYWDNKEYQEEYIKENKK